MFGATEQGGNVANCQFGCGTAFKLAPDRTETVLIKFEGTRGTYSAAPLLLNKRRLYGTSTQGGANKDGVVFGATR